MGGRIQPVKKKKKNLSLVYFLEILTPNDILLKMA